MGRLSFNYKLSECACSLRAQATCCSLGPAYMLIGSIPLRYSSSQSLNKNKRTYRLYQKYSPICTTVFSVEMQPYEKPKKL